MQPSVETIRYRYVRRRWHVLFGLIDAIGRCCALWLAKWRGVEWPIAVSSPQPDDVQRILLVQLDHLGDAVMTTAMLPALRRRFPQASIDVLAAPWNAEVFAARSETSRIFVSRWNRFRRGLRWFWPLSMVYWGRRLRKLKYDLTIDVRGDFPVAVLMAMSGAKRRLGWDSAGGGFLLTDRADYLPGRHEVESRHALLRALGIETRKINAPEFRSTTEADRYITHMLGECQRTDRPLLVFHVGAGTMSKTWPVEHWRELLGRVIVELEARVILVGGVTEVDAARAITQDRFWPGVMDWTGRLTIDQLAALAKRATLFVGADSGPAHLAAAAGAEVLAIFSGASDPGQWRPWGDQVRVLQNRTACAPCNLPRCRYSDHPCLRDLSPADVLAVIREVVEGPPAVPMPMFVKFGTGRGRERS